jgi:hypothetical protein
MRQYDAEKPNPYTCAEAIRKRIARATRPVSKRTALVWSLLAYMPALIQYRYGEGQLIDEQILRMANQKGLA